MDFSVIKSDEKIKPFANYTNPSPAKSDIKGKLGAMPNGNGVEKMINMKENKEKLNEAADKSIGSLLENHKVSPSMESNKMSDRNGAGASKSSENPMGEKGSKIIENEVIFKSEGEYIIQEICRICENEIPKIGGERKNCAICGHTVCKLCSTRKVNEYRVCDLCFLKVKSISSETRRHEFLNLTKNRKEDMKSNISAGKNQIGTLGTEIKNMTEKIAVDEVSYSKTISDLQIKLEQLREKQKQTAEKYSSVMKNYEKKKDLHKALQEKGNETQKFNDSILNNLNTKKQIYLSKFDEFCKLQNHKEDLENSDLYRLVLREQETAKNKEKNKLIVPEESKRQSSAKSSFTNLIPAITTPSYDERKPSILEDKNENSNTGTNSASPQFHKTSVVSMVNQRRNEGDECLCENPCTGNFFLYHKSKSTKKK